MPPLFNGVMQSAIRPGSEQVVGEHSGGKITLNKGEKGNTHKSNSSDNLSDAY